MMRNERDEQGGGPVVRRHESVLHAWLDGTGTEGAARLAGGAAGAREVELWKRVQAEAARRRAVRAPADLCARILVALPPADPPPPPPSLSPSPSAAEPPRR